MRLDSAQLTKLLSRLAPVWLSLLVLLGAIAAALTDPVFVQVLRNAVFDTYQRWHPREYQPSSRVRVIDIDDESLAKVGQWPWPRTLVAELIDRLHDLGAASVAFDILFAEPDRTSPATAFGRWLDLPQISDLVSALPDHDTLLTAAVARDSVVTGFVLTQEADRGHPPAVKAPVVIAGDDPRPFVPTFSGSIASLSLLEEAAAGNGALNVTVSRDGVVREAQLLLVHGERILPTLAAEAVRVAEGASNYLVKSSGASGESRYGARTGVVGVRIGGLAVSTNPRGGVALYFTPPRRERRIPAWKILAGEVPRARLDGTIDFVGTSAAGLKDLRLDPLGNTVAGAEIQAQAVEQILEGAYLRRPDWARAVEVLVMVAMWIILTALILRVGAQPAAFFGAAGTGGSMALSWWAFTHHRLLIDPIFPTLTVIAVYLVCSLSRQLQTEREKRWIRNAFSSYISPNLVRYLIDHPEELDLVGARRECSFVMTDLQGFTSMVEKADPQVVVSLLNQYLDGMVKVALDHGGTLDRIVGDAVAVMFSAPVQQEDHATRAVACALAMDRYCVEWRAARAAEGLKVGRTRIGVNSGTVTIGNVGGEVFFDYRALGDPVNTAARLETVNNQLGTRVCVAASTAYASEGFVGRPVGRLVLKGKTEGIEAFEPLTPEEAASERVAAYQAAFELMKEEHPGAVEAFRDLATRYPDDPLARFHDERLAAGQRGETVVFTQK